MSDALDSRTRLLDAALRTLREKGYASTRVDDLCAAAGLSKGAFFHHFESKEALALAAAEHFQATADAAFEGAPYHAVADPLDRLLGYVDFRIALLDGPLAEVTCLLGTLVQETYTTHPDLRASAHRLMGTHVAAVADLVRAARDAHAPDADWDPLGLARHTQAVLQGAFVLAKAGGGTEVAVESLRHLRRYLQLLFAAPTVAP